LINACRGNSSEQAPEQEEDEDEDEQEANAAYTSAIDERMPAMFQKRKTI